MGMHAFGLPDADDERVVVAAVIAGADVIVTQNLKDFPRALVPAGIELQAPDKFATTLPRSIRLQRCALLM
jgi:hypothetical protein